MAAFKGFDRDAITFLHELAAEQNREWFAANKQRYEDRWVEPMTALLDQLRTRLGSAYGGIKLSEPKLFRIYRDTRFSKDKSPYKTHVAASIGAGSSTAIYLHLGVEEEFIGVGTYFFEDKQIAKWRKLVAADGTGKPLVQMVQRLRKSGYPVGGHEDYKKVPKPYDSDHPRAEFLKMRGLTGGFPEIPRGLLHEPGLTDWLVKHAKKTAPLVVWLARNIK